MDELETRPRDARTVPGEKAPPARPVRTGRPAILDLGQAGKRMQDSPPIGGIFEAISRGERSPTEVHASVEREDPIVEIEDFNLWYGTSQAVHHLSLIVPRGKVTALRAQ